MAFRGDERAQSIQIGAVLLFGLLVIGLSVHQAFVVPNQNKEIEFDHFTEVQDDMEDLRNAVIEAGYEKSTVPTGVSLGTSYPARVLAAQPERSSGVLRTATIGDSNTNEIELENTDANMSAICGYDIPTTRSATYRPSYNYLHSVGNITYENTVTYTNGPDGGRYFQTGQEIIENETIQLYPLVGDYNKGGSSTASVTFRGGTTGENSSVDGPFSLILPTKLPTSEWSDLLDDQSEVTGVDSVSGQRAVNISFSSSGTFDIRCSPAGAGKAPTNVPTVGVDEDKINPAAPGEIQLLAERQGSQNDGAIELKYENQANESINVTSARVNFFQSKSKQKKEPDQFRIFNGTTQESGLMTIGETFQNMDPNVFFPANDTRIIRIDAENSDGSKNQLQNVKQGWLVFTVRFETGEVGTYFIGVPDDGTF